MQNILRGTYCYTIGNLQYTGFSHGINWRKQVKEELEPIGVKILSPLDKIFLNYQKEDEDTLKQLKQMAVDGRWVELRERAKEIRRRDLSACDYSTFLIAVIDTRYHTCGSYDEVFTSLKNNKPVFFHFIGDKENPIENIPTWMWACVPPEFFYSSLEDIIEDIKKIDKGEKQIDQKYWKILEK